MKSEFERVQERLNQFTEVRDWEQFHSPKNLAMALCVEAAELLEVFQWVTEEESSHLDPKQQKAAEEELADVQIYLIRLADQLGVELLAAVEDKITKNENKYPVEKSRGNSKKYTEL